LEIQENFPGFLDYLVRKLNFHAISWKIPGIFVKTKRKRGDSAKSRNFPRNPMKI
jgi:hypothetical protein